MQTISIRLDKETQQLLYSLTFAIIAWYASSLAAVVVQKLSLGTAHQEPLNDLGFYLLPSISVQNVSDMYCYPVALIPLAALCMVHKRYMMVLSRLLVITSFAMGVRTICIAVTLLPSPDTTCVISHTSGSSFLDALQVMFWARFTCADVFFSGHACMLVISSLFVRDYASDILNDNAAKAVVVISWLLTAFGCVLILVARHSYTIAIIVGVMVAFQIHEDYHAYLGVKTEDWFEEKTVEEKRSLLK